MIRYEAKTQALDIPVKTTKSGKKVPIPYNHHLNDLYDAEQRMQLTKGMVTNYFNKT